MKLFSVVILNYNQEDYIKEAIDSVLFQDYGRIEIIIADDASNFFDKKNLLDYIVKNKKSNIERVEIIENNKNIGTVKTLNKVIKHVKGDYVLLFAADDCLFDINVLTRFEKEFNDHEEMNIITSQALMCDNNLDYNEETEKFVPVKLATKLNKVSAKKQYYNIANVCIYVSGATVYRRNAFDIVGNFDEEFVLTEDWSYWLKCLLANQKIYYFDFISLLHRSGGVSHSDNEKKTPSELKYYNDIIKIYTKLIIPYLKDAPINLKYPIVSKYMFYLGRYDNYIDGLYEKNIDNTKLAWKYTNYKMYFFMAQVYKRIFKRGIRAIKNTYDKRFFVRFLIFIALMFGICYLKKLNYIILLMSGLAYIVVEFIFKLMKVIYRKWRRSI